MLAADGRPPASRAELDAQARWLAGTLATLGVARDQTVAVALPNGPEMAAAFLGVASAAVCAPVNPRATAAEAELLLADASAVALVTLSGHETAAHAAAAERGLLRVELEPGPLAGILREGDAPAPPRPSPHDVALVLPTSGTTSRPKLVPLTHENLAASAASVATTLRLTPADRCLNVMPLFHIHGLVAGLLASLRAGGSVVCAPGFESEAFAGWLEALRPTWYTAVPTIHHEALAAADAGAAGLRLIRSSSAPLSPNLMRELEAAFGVPVVEAYGMTEAAHQIASNPLPPGERRPGTVGHAAGPELAVMDETGRLLAPGEEGEVVIRGPSTTPGYVANPEANAAAFTAGWFRTGDLGVLDGDGYLTLTGRKKELINRGGEKIAPREVDEALLEHPDVERAVTFATPHPTLGEDVAAAVVLRPGAASGSDELRRFLDERLTAHKVPRRIVPVDEIPRGPTGKLQRIGLAEQLGLTHPLGNGAGSTAATPTQAALAGIWSYVLGVESVPVDEDFVALGGDSLRGARLLAHVTSLTGVGLPLSTLFEAGSTVDSMARLVDERRARGPATALARPEPGAGEGVLSFFQESVWFLDRLDEGVAAYNAPLLLRLRGPLDTAALHRALELLIERHAGLRTTVRVDEDGRPRALVTAPGPVALDAVEAAEKEALEAAAVESARTFELERGPLFRLRLWRLAPEEHLLLFVQHHLVTDGWSRGILVDELGRAYGALAAGGEPRLEPLPLSYADLAAWQRRRLAAGELGGSLSWWRKMLADLPPPLDLPADRARPGRQSYAGATVDAEVGGETRAGLIALASAHGATPFMALLAGFTAVLHRLTGRDDLLVGVPVARRNLPEAENVVGPFVDTLPLRLDLSGNPPFVELLARVRRAWLGALDHQDVPVERLVEEANPERDLSRPPLFQVLLQLRNLPKRAASFPSGLEVSEERVETATAKLDLSVDVVDDGSRLLWTYEYATALFERSSIERLAERVGHLLAQAVADPSCRLSALPLLPDDERRLLLSLGDGGALPEEGGGTLLDRFRAHAHAEPDALAVADEHRRLTYAEVAARAASLAQRLREAGVEPGAVVGVRVPRSAEAIVALLGVLEAGAAYLPLDPTNPPPRLAAMLEDARPPLVVTHAGASDLPRGVRTLELDGAPAEHNAVLPRPGLDDPAYVLFTSGSTGRPKGVAGSHRTLAARARFAWDAVPPEPGEVYAQRTSFSFVDHTWEVFGALGSGAAVAVVSDETVLDPDRLVQRLAGERVTRLVLVPSLLSLLLEAVPDLGERPETCPKGRGRTNRPPNGGRGRGAGRRQRAPTAGGPIRAPPRPRGREAAE